MAARNSTHTHRHEQAQPINHSDPNANANADPDPDPARQARAQLRRAKEAARYRIHEATASARTGDERAGPGIGDHQGEVA